jgi:RimJ/RimL family protein N-acetyltransferase
MSSLTTSRLTLVRWREEHLVELLVLASDERVVRYIVDGRPWSREYATDRHHSVLAHWNRYGYGWRAVLDESGTFIGVASMTHRSIAEIEIGWWVAPARWGQGIATELAAALLDEAFKQHGVRRVLAGHQDGNDASGRVMTKIGMVHDHSEADPTQHGRLVHVYVAYLPDFQH